MGLIYKITNTINNKVYIGQTTKSLSDRWQTHLKDSSKERKEHRPLYSAFKKYGVQFFKIELIEEVSDDLLCEREQFYIQQYRSYVGFDDCNGYNATLGGDFRTTFDWTSDRLEYLIQAHNFGYNCRIIAHNLGCCVDLVYDKLKQLGYTNISNGGGKIVCQLDLNGELIAIHKSVKVAAESLGSSNKNLHISEVCKGKRKTGGGYR